MKDEIAASIRDSTGTFILFAQELLRLERYEDAANFLSGAAALSQYAARVREVPIDD